VLISVLGATELYDEAGAAVHVGGVRRRAVFAALALEINRVVAVERLLGIVWDERVPAQGRAALQGHIAALRRLLPAPLAVETRDGGYRLTGDPETVDSARFANLVARSMREPDDVMASRTLEAALGMWRGEALADLLSLGFFQSISGTMRETRARAAELWAWRELRMGEGARAIAQIQPLLYDDPTRESLISVLMLCLDQSGRRAQALEVYQQASRRLGRELGTRPGPLLQDALAKILRGADQERHQGQEEGKGQEQGQGRGLVPEQRRELGQDRGHGQPRVGDGARWGRGRAADVSAAVVALPRPPFGFVGRQAQLRSLDALLEGGGAGYAAARVAVVTGAAGVGKTALLLHWGHRVAERFPDGCLYADLQGTREDAALPARVLKGFLTALGATSPLPESEQELAGLFREYCRGRRILVLLDDARGAEQVRSLLPEEPGCGAVVASRFTPIDLVVDRGAVLTPVPPLTAGEARRLLEAQLGAERLAAQESDTARLIELCDRQPLALRLAAARLALRPSWGIGDLGRELGDDGALENDFLGGLATALDATRRRLVPSAARLLSLLETFAEGEGDGEGEREIGIEQAARALRGDGGDAGGSRDLGEADGGGGGLAEAGRALRNLTAWNLLEEKAPGTYAWSGLVARYVRGLGALERAAR